MMQGELVIAALIRRSGNEVTLTERELHEAREYADSMEMWRTDMGHTIIRLVEPLIEGVVILDEPGRSIQG
jgi:hypothetical protein